MRKFNRLVVVTSMLALAGCASMPQQFIAFPGNAYTSAPVKVGVVMTHLPRVDTKLPGASCLLCLAAAATANSALNSYSHTLPYEDLPNLKAEAVSVLQNDGIDAVAIAEDLDLSKLQKNRTQGRNLAKFDFMALKSKYQVDKLLVIQITALGFVRPYAAYFPTGDPEAQLTGVGYIVDLNTNALEWYDPISVVKASEGPWHEPPKFPGLTNAYFQTLEIGKDEFLTPLAKH